METQRGRIFKNSSWLIADKIIRMGLGLFVTAWVARYLGPSNFGLWNYGLAWAFILMPIASMGLDSILIRELVKRPNEMHHLLGTALGLRLIGAAISVIVMASSAHAFNDPAAWTIALITITQTILQSFDVVDYFFQSRVEARYTIWARSMALFIFSGIKISLILSKAPLMSFVWASFGEIALAELFLVISFSRQGHAISSWRWRSHIARELLANSWPFIFTGLCTMAFMRMDQLFLQRYLGSESLGQYAAAIKLSEIWYFIPGALTASVFPFIVASKEESADIFRIKLVRVMAFLILVNTMMAIGVTVLATPIIHLLYGNAYHLGPTILRIHIWTGLFVSIGLVTSQWMVAHNYQRLSFFYNLITALIALALNLILIPRIGIYGAACSSLGAQFTMGLLVNVISPKTHPLLSLQGAAFQMAFTRTTLRELFSFRLR